MTEESLRLLFFCGGTYVAGGELHMLGLMRELKRRGHRVECVMSGWHDGQYLQQLMQAGIAAHPIKLGWIYLSRPDWTLDGLVNYPKAIRDTARVIRKFAPHFCFHAGYRTVLSLAGLLDPQTTVLHVVETPFDSRRTKLAYRLAARRCKRLLTNSEFLRERLIHLGVPSTQVGVSYPVIDLADSVRADVCSNRESIRLGIVGQIIERKGHRDLFTAVAKLREPRKKLEIHVYGTGHADKIEELKELTRCLEIADLVCWHGFVPDRTRIYENLDIIAMPTRDEEAFGMVAAEPALWELPVVAPRSGGVPEIVVSGKTGLLYRPGDTAGLAAAIGRLVQSPALRHSLGQAARRHILARFSPAVVVDRLLADVLAFSNVDGR